MGKQRGLTIIVIHRKMVVEMAVSNNYQLFILFCVNYFGDLIRVMHFSRF